jgi:hypothetical protein
MCDHMSRILDAWVKGILGDDNPLNSKYDEGDNVKQS